MHNLFYTLLTSWLVYGVFAYLHQVAKTYQRFYAAQEDVRFILPWAIVRLLSLIASLLWLLHAVSATYASILAGVAWLLVYSTS